MLSAAVVAADPVIAPLITTASANYQTEILAVAVVGLGIGIVILTLKRGWGLFRGFTR